MLRWFLDRKIAAAERALGVPLDYLRFLAAHSLAGTWRMARFVRLAEYQTSLPPAAAAVAAIVSAQADDCGTCVQIGVNLARQKGVDQSILQAVVAREPDRLPDELADVYRFAAEVTAGHDDDELRARLRRRYGEVGLIDLAFVIAMHRVYPTFKRTLGYAKSCSQVTVAT